MCDNNTYTALISIAEDVENLRPAADVEKLVVFNCNTKKNT